MENIRIELGKEYTCEKCGKTEVCENTCYGTSYTIKFAKYIWCRECEMVEYFKEFGTANE